MYVNYYEYNTYRILSWHTGQQGTGRLLTVDTYPRANRTANWCGSLECGFLTPWCLVLLALFPFVLVLTKSSSVVGVVSLLV